MIFANTHNHSTFSDGVYTPEELVVLAKKEGYGAVVLTDHDTVRGYYFMQKAARKYGLLTLLGCEFSTEGFDGENFHLVGIDFNTEAAQMKKLLKYCAERELKRTKLLLERAMEKGHIKGITWQEVMEENPYNDYLCNNHIFNLLVKKNILKEDDYEAFFDPDFKFNPEVDREIESIIHMKHPDIEYVIKTILDAGGVPVLAHGANQEKYTDDLVKMGLKGVEVKHVLLDKEASRFYTELATEHNLYMLGGTDHNGVLGGYLNVSEEYKVDPYEAGIDKEHFMQLYTRALG